MNVGDDFSYSSLREPAEEIYRDCITRPPNLGGSVAVGPKQVMLLYVRYILADSSTTNSTLNVEPETDVTFEPTPVERRMRWSSRAR